MLLSGRLDQTKKAMERQYGDCVVVAKMTGRSLAMVRAVANDRRKNKSISDAFQRLFETRKRVAVEMLVREIKNIKTAKK